MALTQLLEVVAIMRATNMAAQQAISNMATNCHNHSSYATPADVARYFANMAALQRLLPTQKTSERSFCTGRLGHTFFMGGSILTRQ